MSYRYFIKLSYNGKPFNGWQKQKNAISVQEVVENAFSTLLKQKIEIVGCGRTDTGVHAKNYVAHFDSNTEIQKKENLLYHINQILPFEVVVHEIIQVIPNAHARFDAVSRTYQYVVTQTKDPFHKEFSAFVKFTLDIDIMNLASNLLLMYDDFTSFCKLHSDNKTNICKVTEAFWTKEGDKLIFTITADRFLRNMVRAIVGTLLQVGSGKIQIEHFQNIIEERNRDKAGTSAPANGLYLTNITYPARIFMIN